MPVTKITTDAAREFVRKRKAEGVGNAAINGSLAALRRMLNIAREDGKINIVPKIHFAERAARAKGISGARRF